MPVEIGSIYLGYLPWPRDEKRRDGKEQRQPRTLTPSEFEQETSKRCGSNGEGKRKDAVEFAKVGCDVKSRLPEEERMKKTTLSCGHLRHSNKCISPRLA